MTVSDTSRPATVASGHLVLTEELRDRIRDRLLGMLDAATRRLERQDRQDVRDSRELTDAIEEIRSALVKLDAGYYGVCEMCEGPIPFEQLDATPSVRSCLVCQASPPPDTTLP